MSLCPQKFYEIETYFYRQHNKDLERLGDFPKVSPTFKGTAKIWNKKTHAKDISFIQCFQVQMCGIKL